MKKSKERIFGNRIKIILKEIGMSQQQLAELTSLHPSYISKVILGKRRCISLPIAFKISEALNKSVEEVFKAKQGKSTNEEED